MSTVHTGPAPESSGRDHFHPGLATKAADAAACVAAQADGPARIVLVNGAPRSDGSWAGEAARTWRLTELARATLQAEGAIAEVLDLGLALSEAAIRDALLAAHGIVVLAPAHGDALDGMRHALNEPQLRALLAERAYGLVVHGDMAAICHARGALADWLDGLGLVDSDSFGPLTRFVGYYEPEQEGAEQDMAEPAEPDIEEESRNVARAVHKAVTELRAGRLAGAPLPGT